MKILHAISSLQQTAGTSVFCVEVADHLAKLGVDCDLAVSHYNPEDVLVPQICSAPRQIVNFDDYSTDYDLIHTHALWDMLPHKAVRFGVKNKIPVCISPHGMLTEWALNNSKWKKRLAMLLYQWRDLKSVSLFHATAESEVEDIRRLGLRQPVVVAPLGVNLPDLSLRQRARIGALDARKTILFISRIHPKKGLMNLLDAWNLIRDENWRIIIAGPDERGHSIELKEKVKMLGLTEDVTIMGPVYGAEKNDLYLQADLFVLPSYSENFGVVVPEALAAGLPVITTKATPWQELQGSYGSEPVLGTPNSLSTINYQLSTVADSIRNSGRCGWWIDLGVGPLIKALKEAIDLNDKERELMGAVGRKLVGGKYLWKKTAESLDSAYDWLLNGGQLPDCVDTV